LNRRISRPVDDHRGDDFGQRWRDAYVDAKCVAARRGGDQRRMRVRGPLSRVLLDTVRASGKTSSDSRRRGARPLPDAAARDSPLKEARHAPGRFRSSADCRHEACQLRQRTTPNQVAQATEPLPVRQFARSTGSERTRPRPRLCRRRARSSRLTLRERRDRWIEVIAAAGCGLESGLIATHFRQRRDWLELFPLPTIRDPEICAALTTTKVPLMARSRVAGQRSVRRESEASSELAVGCGVARRGDAQEVVGDRSCREEKIGARGLDGLAEDPAAVQPAQ
jgi:hypothetical protein